LVPIVAASKKLQSSSFSKIFTKVVEEGEGGGISYKEPSSS